MMFSVRKKQRAPINQILSVFIATVFIFNSIIPPSFAQVLPTILNLPAPGSMVMASPGYTPTLVKGITIDPINPLAFDFIVDRGDVDLQGDALTEESRKLIKYFLATLTTPEDKIWVNLSPYERNQMIAEGLGETELGRDLLAQDYLLKQLTASLMYPEEELGSKFWDRVHEKAYDLYGTTDIPLNTFTKIWIVPDVATVYEHNSTAFVVQSRLKVMLEEDYLALQKNLNEEKYGTDALPDDDVEIISGVTSEIVKEVLIPEIEKEINEGKNFANLRQIYHSMILATWYKKTLKDSLLGQVYVNKNKTKGIDVKDKTVNEKIYNQYLKAFEKGVYGYIKEGYDPTMQESVPRKYFSGGAAGLKSKDLNVLKGAIEAQTPRMQQIIRNIIEDNEHRLTADDILELRVQLVEISANVDKDFEEILRNLAFLPENFIQEINKSSFIRAEGMHFYKKGERFYVKGINFWHAIHLADERTPGGWKQLMAELDVLQDTGVNTLRIMGSFEGSRDEQWSSDPITKPSLYGIDGLSVESLERLMDELERRGMYAIVTMNNMWPWSGGFAKYIEMRTGKPVPYPPPARDGNWDDFQKYSSEFYNDPIVQEAYRQLLQYIVPHLKDRKSVLAWELANEPRANQHPKLMNEWIHRTAKLIKELDPNHMVTTGSEGKTPYKNVGMDVIKNHKSEYIDFVTMHAWPRNWGWTDKDITNYPKMWETYKKYVLQHVIWASALGKPIILEETGIQRDHEDYTPGSPTTMRDRFFKDVLKLSAKKIKEGGPFAGVMFWAWTGTAPIIRPGDVARPGDHTDLGDPNHERKHWYGVTVDDTMTLDVLKEGFKNVTKAGHSVTEEKTNQPARLYVESFAVGGAIRNVNGEGLNTRNLQRLEEHFKSLHQNGLTGVRVQPIFDTRYVLPVVGNRTFENMKKYRELSQKYKMVTNVVTLLDGGVANYALREAIQDPKARIEFLDRMRPFIRVFGNVKIDGKPIVYDLINKIGLLTQVNEDIIWGRDERGKKTTTETDTKRVSEEDLKSFMVDFLEMVLDEATEEAMVVTLSLDHYKEIVEYSPLSRPEIDRVKV